MRDEIEVVIFGVGGVGSRVAEMLYRYSRIERRIKTIYLIDGDEVETKNLSRQNFIASDCGKLKTKALKDYLDYIGGGASVIICSQFIQNEEILRRVCDENTICIGCTDDVESKRLIGRFFKDYMIVSVDRGLVEITVDREYDKVWSFGTGYDVVQDVLNNTFASAIVCKVFKDWINGKKLTKNIRYNINTLSQQN
jgi:predicted ThiF/HesA family dinucleotide-utilizing enzyme